MPKPQTALSFRFFYPPPPIYSLGAARGGLATANLRSIGVRDLSCRFCKKMLLLLLHPLETVAAAKDIKAEQDTNHGMTRIKANTGKGMATGQGPHDPPGDRVVLNRLWDLNIWLALSNMIH